MPPRFLQQLTLRKFSRRPPPRSISECDDNMFRRGAILSNRPIGNLPSTFMPLAVEGLHIAHHVADAVHVQRSGRQAIVLFGYAICSMTGVDDGARIAEILLNCLTRGPETLYNYLQTLGGRYVVAFRDGDRWRLVNDAAGMRSLYFGRSATARYVATHVNLIAMQDVDAPPRKMASRLGYPGNLTPLAGVYLHNPSTVLALDDFDTARPFLLGASRSYTPQEVAAAILRRGRTQAAALARPGDAVVSLTAGVDSRMTLACLLPTADRFRFFTYDNGAAASLERDVEGAQALAASFGLTLRLVPVPAAPIRRDLLRVLANNTMQEHGQKLAQALVDAFGAQAGRHVRSNIGEVFHVSDIDKFAYRARRTIEDYRDVAAAYRTLAAYPPDSAVRVDEAFRFWSEKGRHGESRLSMRDAYFVEHRMASWVANVLNEQDVAFDTTILFNTRELLNMAAAVPRRIRATGAIPREVFRQSGYDLTRLPINGKSWR